MKCHRKKFGNGERGSWWEGPCHIVLSSASQFPFGVPHYFGLKGQVDSLYPLKDLPSWLVMGLFVCCTVKNGTVGMNGAEYGNLPLDGWGIKNIRN